MTWPARPAGAASAGPPGHYPTSHSEAELGPLSGAGLAAGLGWRVVVVAVTGYIMADLVRDGAGLLAFLQFSLLQVFIAFGVYVLAVLRPLTGRDNRDRLEGVVGWARGMALTYSLMTMVVVTAMLGGADVRPIWNVIHYVVPAVLAVDWVLVGRNQERLPVTMPLFWLIPMAVYLGIYAALAATGTVFYPFLDPAEPEFWPMVVFLLVAWTVMGYVVLGLGRLRRKVREGRSAADLSRLPTLSR